jgi:hypothetical protein
MIGFNIDQNNKHTIYDYIFMIPRDIILKLLRQGNMISIYFLKKCDMFDREIALVLLANKIYNHISMCDYVTPDEVRAQLIYSGITTGDRSLIVGHMSIYDSYTLDMVLLELCKNNCTDADIIERYTEWSYEFSCFSHDLQDQYKDRFIQLFPLIVLGGYYQISDALRARNAELYDGLLDLLDRAMGFSDDPIYVTSMSSCIDHKYFEYGRTAFTNALCLLIATKHPRYFMSVLYLKDKDDLCGDTQINNAIDTAYWRRNEVQLIKSNIKYDYEMIHYLPDHEIQNIGADIFNDCLRQCYKCWPITLSDVYKVKYGADLDDADIIKLSDIDIVRKLLPTKLFDIIAIKSNRLTAEYQISCDHIITLARINPVFLNKLSGRDSDSININDTIWHLLPTLYDEFVNGISKLELICAQNNMPQDIVDLMRLYYINASADDADIDYMLRLFKE